MIIRKNCKLTKALFIVLLTQGFVYHCLGQSTSIFKFGHVTEGACKVKLIKTDHSVEGNHYHFETTYGYKDNRVAYMEALSVKNGVVMSNDKYIFFYDSIDRLSQINNARKKKEYFYDQQGDLVKIQVSTNEKILNYTLLDYQNFASTREISVKTFSTSRGDMKLYADYKLYLSEDELVQHQSINYYNYGTRNINRLFKYDAYTNPMYHLNLNPNLSSIDPDEFLSPRNCTEFLTNDNQVLKRTIHYNHEKLPVSIAYDNDIFKTYTFEYDCQNM